MDPRKAFLDSAVSLIHGYTQLAHFRNAGNTALICILDVNVVNPSLYESVNAPAVEKLKAVDADEFRTFEYIFQESSMVLAFSWLESFLGEIEYALYLQHPVSLGEDKQVKLGKILDAGSIEELLHDLARRSVRDRSQWGLARRFDALKQRGFQFTQTDEDIAWMVSTRNRIIHDRTLGSFRVTRRKVEYEFAPSATYDIDVVRRFLDIASNSVVDLYDGASQALRITSRNSRHKENLERSKSLRRTWRFEAATTADDTQQVESAQP